MVNKIQLVGVEIGRGAPFAAKKTTSKFVARPYSTPAASYLKYKVRFNPQLSKKNFCKNVLELF
jgi:hypothetical protein